MPKKSNKMTMVQQRKLGGALGGLLGGLGSALMPIPGVSGQQVGQFLGNLLPFRRGTASVKRRRRGGK